MNGAYEQINPEPSQPMATPNSGGGSSWVAWVIGIFLVIIVGGGLYYYYNYIKIPELNTKIDNLQTQIDQLNAASESTDETADWKTYTDDVTGVSFKYPTDYNTNLSDKVLVGDAQGKLILVGPQESLSSTKNIAIYVFPKNTTQNLNAPNGMDSSSSSSLSIGEQDAKKYIGIDSDAYVVNANSRRYEIIMPKSLTQEKQDEFSKIL